MVILKELKTATLSVFLLCFVWCFCCVSVFFFLCVCVCACFVSMFFRGKPVVLGCKKSCQEAAVRQLSVVVSSRKAHHKIDMFDAKMYPLVN